MSAENIADNPTVRHPTPTTAHSASARVAAAYVESRRTRSKEVPTATNDRRVAAVADRFLLGEFNGDPIDPWNTSSVTNMYDWEAVVFNQPINQWQMKLATSCK